ncbi:MAG TPA: hypothetical protein VMF30_01465, partial [Pirellulales bacterium]|nr:hypothetical protein [Pirellulales bacterium]
MLSSFYWAVGQNVIGAAVLALAVFGITRFWKNPAVRHALWLLVLVKLVAPPLVALPLPGPSARPPIQAIRFEAAPAWHARTVDGQTLY